MAAFLKLWKERNCIVQSICESCRESDALREKEFSAAITLQSWFRGCRVRAYIKHLNSCAVRIQKTYRGYCGRKLYRKQLKEHLENLRKNYYNRMASLIQSTWKGYYTRKYLYNYYARKEYFEGLKVKNEIMRARLNDYQQKIVNEQLQRDEELHKLQTDNEAKRLHYMMSTESAFGVFAGSDGSLPIEEKMKTLKFYIPHQKRNLQSNHHSMITQQSSVQSWSDDRPTIDLSATSGDCRVRHSLPPLCKPQGPFKDSNDIWYQRRKPLSPTLRTSTTFECVEQARLQLKLKEQQHIIIDEKFLPFAKTTYPLTPTLNSQSYYTRPSYGNKYFREETPHKRIVQQKFQTVIPPISLFNKH